MASRSAANSKHSIPFNELTYEKSTVSRAARAHASCAAAPAAGGHARRGRDGSHASQPRT